MKRPKINEKEAGVGQFKKKLRGVSWIMRKNQFKKPLSTFQTKFPFANAKEEEEDLSHLYNLNDVFLVKVKFEYFYSRSNRQKLIYRSKCQNAAMDEPAI